MYTVYTQLPPERNSIYQNHLIKLLLWKLWLCWDDPKQKPFFQCSESSEQATVQPFNTKKPVLNSRMCRRKKEKKNVVLQAPWKFSIDWILMKMSVLNTTWQMFFPGFILGQTRNQLPFRQLPSWWRKAPEDTNLPIISSIVISTSLRPSTQELKMDGLPSH